MAHIVIHWFIFGYTLAKWLYLVANSTHRMGSNGYLKGSKYYIARLWFQPNMSGVFLLICLTSSYYSPPWVWFVWTTNWTHFLASLGLVQWGAQGRSRMDTVPLVTLSEKDHVHSRRSLLSLQHWLQESVFSVGKLSSLWLFFLCVLCIVLILLVLWYFVIILVSASSALPQYTNSAQLFWVQWAICCQCSDLYCVLHLINLGWQKVK